MEKVKINWAPLPAKLQDPVQKASRRAWISGHRIVDILILHHIGIW